MSDPTLDYFNSLLPSTVTFNVARGTGERSSPTDQFFNLPSYFNANVFNSTGYDDPSNPDNINLGAGSNGPNGSNEVSDTYNWDAWCVDTATGLPNLSNGTFINYDANVYSTYGTIPSSVLAPLDLDTSNSAVDSNGDGYVDRLQALNWLFNFVIEDANKYGPTGSPLDSGYLYDITGDNVAEQFNVATMQLAIWTLLGQSYNNSTGDDYFGLINPNPTLANQLVNYVLTGVGDADGNGVVDSLEFIPDPALNQTVAVILAPVSGTNQPIVIEVPVIGPPPPPPTIVPPTFEKYVDGECICGDESDYVEGYGFKADGGTGPSILAGAAVTWTYVVSGSNNPQAVPLTISLVDDNGTPLNNGDDFNPTYQSGDTNSNNLLDSNETWIYTASGTATSGVYTNTATLGYQSGENGGFLTDDATYNGYVANLSLDKVTSDGVNTGDGIEVVAGAAITWKYTVTNLGSSTVALKDIVIVDDNGTAANTSDDFSTTSGGITYYSGDLNSNGLLDIGESWIYKASGTAQQGSYSNTATVTANPDGLCSTGDCITDSDSSSYTGIKEDIPGFAKTPGFWRQAHHFQYWPTGCLPTNTFSGTFGLAGFSSGGKFLYAGKTYFTDTLLGGVTANGGGVNALARAATAGLLNAKSDELNSNVKGDSISYVIDQTKLAAIAGSNFNAVLQTLQKVDLNSDQVIGSSEVIKAVQDAFGVETSGFNYFSGNAGINSLATALDTMNNMGNV